LTGGALPDRRPSGFQPFFNGRTVLGKPGRVEGVRSLRPVHQDRIRPDERFFGREEHFGGIRQQVHAGQQRILKGPIFEEIFKRPVSLKVYPHPAARANETGSVPLPKKQIPIRDPGAVAPASREALKYDCLGGAGNLTLQDGAARPKEAQ
jgi:hypothetical protein